MQTKTTNEQPESGIGLDSHSPHCNCKLCHLAKNWTPTVEASRDLVVFANRARTARFTESDEYEMGLGRV